MTAPGLTPSPVAHTAPRIRPGRVRCGKRCAKSRLLVAATAAVCAWTGAAPAQLIPIKTVPVAEGDQLAIFPSSNAAMGAVSVALSDSLLDPFVNPATSARLRRTRFFGSPAFYNISANAGGGRTLPLGALLNSGAWSGGAVLALQEVDLNRRPLQPPVVCPDICALSSAAALQPDLLRDRSATNRYAFGALARRLNDRGLSLGGSITWAGLHAVDGVELLYPGSWDVDQAGHMVDVRLGVVKAWGGGRTLEALVLHNRTNMRHDVRYLAWAPEPVRLSGEPPTPSTWTERNRDRTNTWGAHVRYERPLTETGWRFGALVTGNVKTHPAIPNYELMDIPRDPGHSLATDFGIGVAKVHGQASFGLDVIYEPIWSRTWAEAHEAVATPFGTIPPGGRTVENDFRFSNAVLRTGFSQDIEIGRGRGTWAGLQAGLALRAIRYWMDQTDHVVGFSRSQHERWQEWTPTWGASLRLPELEIRYTGRLTTGTGRPGVAWSGFRTGAAVPEALSSNYLVAPSGPLTLQEARVTTHQLAVSLPLR